MSVVQKLNIYWKKGLAALCIFGTMFLFLGFSGATNSNMRMIDGEIGLLKIPVGASLRFSQLFFSGIEAEAITCSNCTTEVGETVRYNIEKGLREGLRKLLLSFLNSFMQLVLSNVEKIMAAIEDSFQSVLGLQVNIGSALSGMAMQGVSLYNQGVEQINAFVDRIMPVKDPEVATASAEAIYSIDVASAVANIQKKVPNKDSALPVPPQSQIENAKDKVASAMSQISASSKCKDAYAVPLWGAWNGGVIDPATGEYLEEPYCPANQQDKLAFKKEIDARTKGIESTVAQGVDTLEKQGADECNNTFYVEGGDSGVAPVSQSANTKIPLMSHQVDSIASTTKVKPVPKRFCEGNTIDLFGHTIGTSAPGGEVDSWDGVLKIFQQIIGALVDKIISFLTNLVTKIASSINNAVSGITGGYLGSIISEVTGTINQGVSQALRSQADRYLGELFGGNST